MTFYSHVQFYGCVRKLCISNSHITPGADKNFFRKRIVYEGAVQEKTSIALLCSLIDEFTSSENVTFAD